MAFPCASSSLSSNSSAPKDSTSHKPQRFGSVTLCGAPNAGKSTLLNNLLGEKVAAVSSKPQTTRFNITAVKEYGATQIAFVDTPGLFRPTNDTGRLLRKSSFQALKSTDALLLLVDISLKNQDANLALVEQILRKFQAPTQQDNAASEASVASATSSPLPIFLAFNKIDKVKEQDVVARAFSFQRFPSLQDFFMISAATGEGVEPLLQALLAKLPEGPWAYPAQSSLQMDLNRWLSEMTMEQVFEHLHQEIPYQAYIETISLQEGEDGLHIYQNLILAKEGQKRIVIGHKGQTLKQIGMRARQNIGGALKRRVHLHLLVKIKEDWMSHPTCLTEAGFKAG